MTLPPNLSKELEPFPDSQRTLIERCRNASGAFQYLPPECFEQTVTQCFETQAHVAGDRLAISDHQGTLSYQALNARANQLARTILQQCGENTRTIGVFIRPSVETAIAFLGILKAGKIYVPLDVSDPGRALSAVVEDAAIQTVLVTTDTDVNAAQWLPDSVDRINVDDVEQQTDHSNLESRSSPDDPVYIIYSSGSTGQPKGVVQIHRHLLHDRRNLVNFYGLSPTDETTHLHASIHATSPTDLTNAFLSGAAVHVWDFSKHGLADLPAWLVDRQITVLHWVPGLFRALCDSLDEGFQFNTVRLIVLGSEPVTRRDLECYRQYFPDSTLFINRLGSVETENTRLYYANKRTPLPDAGLPVGYELPGRTITLVDESGNLCSADQEGEILVRSQFLAREYWQSPDLTEAAFSEKDANDTRTFRTRDLGRLSADGCLTYIGRKDNRFKVRGLFVDPLEVEAALTKQNGIREAILVPKVTQASEVQLVAYLVLETSHRIGSSEITAALHQLLPPYAVPEKYIQLDSLPQSAVGKIDRKLLASGSISGKELADSPSEKENRPATELEQTLISIWETVLGVEGIEPHHSFLEKGGNSIRGMMFLNRVRKQLKIRVHVTALFDAPTITEFAAYLVKHYDLSDGPGSTEPNDRPSNQSLTPEVLKPFQDIAMSAWSNQGSAVPSAPTKNPRAIFILAPPRSGTTLLRIMLGGHPRLFSPPELHLLGFRTLRERQSTLVGRYTHHQEGTIRAIMEAMSCDVETATSFMQECTEQEMTVQQFYLRLQHLCQDRMLVDKTPEYTHHIDTLRRAETWFEDPLYIHLLRHPCGQIVSYEDARLDRVTRITHQYEPRTLGELLWFTGHKNTMEFLSEVPTHRQHRLSFEDLVHNPHQTTQKLCNFLQIEYQGNMADPYANLEGRMTDGIHQDSKQLGDEKFAHFRKIDPAIADRWRAAMSMQDLSSMTKELANSLGYPTT